MAQEYFKRGNDILGFSITDVMFEGSSEDLKQTKFSQPANYNALHQVVISGEMKALKEACEKLRPAAIRVINLPVSGAFHSPFMEPIVEEFKLVIEKTKFKNPICPIYQNVKG